MNRRDLFKGGIALARSVAPTAATAGESLGSPDLAWIVSK